MKSFKQMLNESLSDEEWLKRARINDPIWKDMRDISNDISKEVEILRNICVNGYSGKKVKDCSRDLTKYCKDIIELSKKLQELII